METSPIETGAGSALGIQALKRRVRFDGLWRHPDFMRLWAGQTVSQLGSTITREALPYTAILTLGATPAQMGLLGAASGAPLLLFGLLAGVWVDRLRRRPIMIAADLARALLLLSIPLAYTLGLTVGLSGLPLAVGTIQAAETIKLILGIGDPLIGRYLAFDALDMTFREFKIRKDPSNPITWENRDQIVVTELEGACQPAPLQPPS